MAQEMVLVIPAQPPEPGNAHILQAPAPTAEQEQLADQALESRDETQAALTLMGLHAGVTMLHALAVQSLKKDEEEDERQPKGCNC